MLVHILIQYLSQHQFCHLHECKKTLTQSEGKSTTMQPISHSIRQLLIAAALCLGLSVISCQRQQQTGPPPSIPEVTVMTVQTQPLMLNSELPGRTSAYRTAEIRPQVSGLVLKRLFIEGADIKEGDVLYQIDPASFEAALNNALAALARSEASLSAARSREERYRELLVEKAVSQQDYDDALAALEQIDADIQYWKATVETARINLAYTRIIAPISGRIGRSNVTEGAIVTAYQPLALATIQQLDPIYVDVPQSTTEMLRLRKHMEDGRLNQNGKNQKNVKLIMEDETTYPQEGSLQFRDVTVDPTTGSVILRIVFPNPDGFLLPGMFVRAIMREGINEAAILIPQQSVSRDPKGNPMTFVVDAENQVQLKSLNIDRAIGTQWLVEKGLFPGDRIIVEGIQKVRPGASVKVAALKSDASNVNEADVNKTPATGETK